MKGKSEGPVFWVLIIFLLLFIAGYVWGASTGKLAHPEPVGDNPAPDVPTAWDRYKQGRP